MNTLLLIDGNAIMHRAYHALPPFKAADGTPTNVVYGYLSMLNKVVDDFKPDYLISCFDTPKPTFRNKVFKDYQIQRPKIDDEFIVQIPLVKQALDEAGIIRLEKDGFEADDLIGTISQIFDGNKFRVIIVSGDKDIFQLINDNIYVAAPQLGLANIKIFDKTEVEQKLDVSPAQIVDYKALAGDPSDNYPGAKGIGPKTAAKLIHQYGTIDNIYKKLDKIDSEKIKTILENEKDNVFVSKKLATILTDVEISLDIEKSKFKGFNENLKQFLEKYQMNSLVKRIFNENEIKEKAEKPKNNQIGLF
ncbi:MAG: polymerase protein [Candidatus Roizmanbacteria bacterium GW2011_GWC2_37_13]|uniref:Polymerase protein n=1 Tax=Candidatus Roizmanbacteria bacterium GW2011_GWC2_37_13 TaxID=1618486 RepID=A0A0G0JEF8_9BACT|nr:MAG: polymerase protein [Candidatus Roizmanbacteria bacterium GW2011_GWC1_37_12]KKQ26561.1 MAG: polymerase protein [Candidatus Roizmanbacteria bacterium GW2011_GWC2_37_13]